MKYTEIKTVNESLNLSRMIFGTHHFGAHSEYEDCASLLDCYFENGGNILDTARTKEYNRSEEFIGRYLSEHPGLREKIYICTKWGNPVFNANYSAVDHFRVSRNDMLEDLEKSIEFLKTDYIDIYLLHKDNPNLEPEEIIEFMNEPVRQGKVRHIGVSNWPVDRIRRANEYAEKNGLQKIEFSEVAFSLYLGATDGWGERELIYAIKESEYDEYKKLGVTVFAFSSQAYGFFYKNYNTHIENVEAKPINIERLKRLKVLCEKKKITPQQGVLGYFSGLDFTALPIATSTRIEHLLDAINGADVLLSSEETEFLIGKNDKLL